MYFSHFRDCTLIDGHVQIFRSETVLFQHLPELVNRYLAPPDPIILHYTVNPAVPPAEKPGAWDVDVKLEDTVLKSRMAQAVAQMTNESARDLVKLDDEVCF